MRTRHVSAPAGSREVVTSVDSPSASMLCSSRLLILTEVGSCLIVSTASTIMATQAASGMTVMPLT